MTTTDKKVLNALKVMVLTPHIRQYLRANDPKALEQAEQAIARAEYVSPASKPHGFLASDFNPDTCCCCGKSRAWRIHSEAL